MWVLGMYESERGSERGKNWLTVGIVWERGSEHVKTFKAGPRDPVKKRPDL